ncbi:hypothetical protein AMTR_s00058p00157380 [Amborella trichopoda]|uniref:Uncharacterized protein n=1 Tax=Amborella trichopoda TaxID=13333 RepID=W1P9M1_AMBTC|nr:hypothetical protein AMTR_s00058p00157380 [Amborella trichopoda]
MGIGGSGHNGFDEGARGGLCGDGPLSTVVCGGALSPSLVKSRHFVEAPPKRTDDLTARFLMTLTPTISKQTFTLPPPQGKQKPPYKSSSFFTVWLLAFLATAHNRCSVVAFKLLLVIAAKMYPLFHRKAARKSLSFPKPKFDPLLVDPLTVVVLNDPEDAMALEGEVLDTEHGAPAPMVEEEDTGIRVEDPSLALVEVASPPPIDVLRHDDNELQFLRTATPAQVSGLLATGLSRDEVPPEESLPGLVEEQIIAGLVADGDMDYDVPIAEVYKDILDKKKAEKVVKRGDCPSVSKKIAQTLGASTGKAKGKAPVKGSRSSARLQAREELRFASTMRGIVFSEMLDGRRMLNLILVAG